LLTVADQPYRLGHSQASVRPEMDVQAHERMIRLGRWALNQLCCMGFRNRKLGLLLVEKFFVFTRPTIESLRDPATYESLPVTEELIDRTHNHVSVLQLQDFKFSLVQPTHSDLIVSGVVR